MKAIFVFDNIIPFPQKFRLVQIAFEEWLTEWLFKEWFIEWFLKEWFIEEFDIIQRMIS